MGVPSMRILQNPYENMVQWLAQLSLRVLTYQKIQWGIVEMVRSSATKYDLQTYTVINKICVVRELCVSPCHFRRFTR